MINTIISLIAIFIAICSLGYAIYLQIKIKHLKKDTDACFSDMTRQYNSLRKKVDEILVGNLNLGSVLGNLQQSVNTISNKQSELALHDPDSKLYVRAKKMIDLGADLDEVVRECEIPKAEAELLFRVQGKPIAASNAQSEVKRTEASANKPVFRSSGSMNFMSGASSTNKPANKVTPSSFDDDNDDPMVPKEAQAMMQHFAKMNKEI